MRKIYIVRDYDSLDYVGTNLKDAITKVKGSGRVDLYIANQWKGYYTYVFAKKKWIFKHL